MADRLSLNMIETGLRAGLPEARAMVGSPAAALALAEQLLREDRAAVADFHGDAGSLAGWLLNKARRGRQVDAGDLGVPDADPTAAWLRAWDRSTALRDEFQGDRAEFLAYCRHEHRQGRSVPEAVERPPAPRPVEIRAAATTTINAPPPRVGEPEVPAPLAKLATPKASGTTSARLTMAQAGERLGLPMHRLPATRGVVEAMRDAGLSPTTANGIDIELNAADVERVASDREAQQRLLLRLANTVREFGYVGSGQEIRFGT